MTELIKNWNFVTSGKSDKQPILFLHGFMGNANIWRNTIANLDNDFFCVAIDLPGHGQTRADLEYLKFENLADGLHNFVNTQFTKESILVGYSMGGRIALYTALKYPDTFKALVLESSSPGIEDEEERKTRLMRDEKDSAKMKSTDMRSFLTEWYRMPVFDYLNDFPDLKEKIINKKSSNDPQALAEVIVKLSPGTQPSQWSNLNQWTKPILIIAGEKDQKYCHIGKKMHAGLANSRLEIIPNAGHIVHLENHKDFMTVLKSFLASYIL
ncbi:MAG: 2-succinyl-6-hydroxy-2,4-cyclohexadiene-1-carboxylate synthase [candidate division Zixibacteria bacterium]